MTLALFWRLRLRLLHWRGDRLNARRDAIDMAIIDTRRRLGLPTPWHGEWSDSATRFLK